MFPRNNDRGQYRFGENNQQAWMGTRYSHSFQDEQSSVSQHMPPDQQREGIILQQQRQMTQQNRYYNMQLHENAAHVAINQLYYPERSYAERPMINSNVHQQFQYQGETYQSGLRPLMSRNDIEEPRFQEHQYMYRYPPIANSNMNRNNVQQFPHQQHRYPSSPRYSRHTGTMRQRGQSPKKTNIHESKTVIAKKQDGRGYSLTQSLSALEIGEKNKNNTNAEKLISDAETHKIEICVHIGKPSESVDEIHEIKASIGIGKPSDNSDEIDEIEKCIGIGKPSESTDEIHEIETNIGIREPVLDSGEIEHNDELSDSLGPDENSLNSSVNTSNITVIIGDEHTNDVDITVAQADPLNSTQYDNISKVPELCTDTIAPVGSFINKVHTSIPAISTVKTREADESIKGTFASRNGEHANRMQNATADVNYIPIVQLSDRTEHTKPKGYADCMVNDENDSECNEVSNLFKDEQTISLATSEMITPDTGTLSNSEIHEIEVKISPTTELTERQKNEKSEYRFRVLTDLPTHENNAHSAIRKIDLSNDPDAESYNSQNSESSDEENNDILEQWEFDVITISDNTDSSDIGEPNCNTARITGANNIVCKTIDLTNIGPNKLVGEHKDQTTCSKEIHEATLESGTGERPVSEALSADLKVKDSTAVDSETRKGDLVRWTSELETNKDYGTTLIATDDVFLIVDSDDNEHEIDFADVDDTDCLSEKHVSLIELQLKNAFLEKYPDEYVNDYVDADHETPSHAADTDVITANKKTEKPVSSPTINNDVKAEDVESTTHASSRTIDDDVKTTAVESTTPASSRTIDDDVKTTAVESTTHASSRTIDDDVKPTAVESTTHASSRTIDDDVKAEAVESTTHIDIVPAETCTSDTETKIDISTPSPPPDKEVREETLDDLSTDSVLPPSATAAAGELDQVHAEVNTSANVILVEPSCSSNTCNGTTIDNASVACPEFTVSSVSRSEPCSDDVEMLELTQENSTNDNFDDNVNGDFMDVDTCNSDTGIATYIPDKKSLSDRFATLSNVGECEMEMASESSEMLQANANKKLTLSERFMNIDSDRDNMDSLENETEYDAEHDMVIEKGSSSDAAVNKPNTVPASVTENESSVEKGGQMDTVKNIGQDDGKSDNIRPCSSSDGVANLESCTPESEAESNVSATQEINLLEEPYESMSSVGDDSGDSGSEDDDLLGTAPAFLQSVKEISERPPPVTPEKFVISSQGSLDSSQETCRENIAPKKALFGKSQSTFSLDGLLADKSKTEEAKRLMDAIHRDLKSEGGFVAMLDKAEDKVEDGQLTDKHKEVLSNFIVEDSHICNDRPGQPVFAASRYLCLFGEMLHPTHCGFVVPPNAKFIDKYLADVIPERYLQLLTADIIQMCFPKVTHQGAVLRWLLFIMSVHKSFGVQQGCYKILNEILHTQHIKDQPKWSPSVTDIISILVNYGADLDVLIAGTEVSPDSIRSRFIRQPHHIAPPVGEQGAGYQLQNLRLVMEVVAYSLQGKVCSYPHTDLTLLLAALCRASLDTELKNLCAMDVFANCVAMVVKQYSKADWLTQRLRICRLLSGLTQHHHNQLHVAQLLAPDTRGRYLQTRVSMLMLHGILAMHWDVADSALDDMKISELFQYVHHLKNLVMEDPYKLSSVINLLDLCVGSSPLKSQDRDDLQKLVDLVKRVCSEVRDSLRNLDRTRVKDMMVHVCSRWYVYIQATKSKQMKIFQYARHDSPRKLKIEKVETSQNYSSDSSTSDSDDSDDNSSTPRKMPRLVLERLTPTKYVKTEAVDECEKLDNDSNKDRWAARAGKGGAGKGGSETSAIEIEDDLPELTSCDLPELISCDLPL